MKRDYYFKQKLAAIVILICSAVPIVVAQDGTAFVCMLPFCIWMGVTKEKIFLEEEA